MVFVVPELLAGPEDDARCFLFRPISLFGAFNGGKKDTQKLNQVKPTFNYDQVNCLDSSYEKQLTNKTYRS